MQAKEHAQRQAIAWIRKNDPNVYALAVKRHALKNGHANIYGLSAIEEDTIASLSGVTDFFASLTDTALKLVPTIAQASANNKVLKAQLKRADMGLPPLEIPMYQPTLPVEPTYNPQSDYLYTHAATKKPIASFETYLPWIGLGGLALLMVLRR